jgi:hypothetical protein
MVFEISLVERVSKFELCTCATEQHALIHQPKWDTSQKPQRYQLPTFFHRQRSSPSPSDLSV